jgi:hypothetical protein
MNMMFVINFVIKNFVIKFVTKVAISFPDSCRSCQFFQQGNCSSCTAVKENLTSICAVRHCALIFEQLLPLNLV